MGAATLLDAIQERPALSGRIVAAVRVAERRWNLRMKNNADIMLPEGHEAAALDRLLQLHQTQSILDRPLSAIDLRFADKLVVRPRPEAKPDGKADGKSDSKPSTTAAGAPTVPVSSKKPI
jgi:cell division protein FtsQ